MRPSSRSSKHSAKHLIRGSAPGRRGLLVIGVIAALTLSLFPALAANAAPASIHEITANWTGKPVPTEAPFGQPVAVEWHINTNDVDDPYSNEPVDNVRATLTAGNGVFTSIPAICKITGVTPISEISANGTVLTCNLGTVKEGTAKVIQTPVRATAPDGGNLTVTGTATSDTAAAEAGPADPGPLPITYSHGMDISLVSAPGINHQGFTADSRTGGKRIFMQMNYSVVLTAGSRPGPDSYSFPVTVASNIPGADAGLQWENCVPVTSSSTSTGQPFSDPAQADRTNFSGCSVNGSGNNYTVALSGLDYTLVNTPAKDSLGQPLPGTGSYIASGTVQFSIPAPVTQITDFTFKATPDPFTFTDGTVAADADATNNGSNTTLTPPGTFSNYWLGAPAASRAPWDANLWVSPGTGQDQADALRLYMQVQESLWNGYTGPGGDQMGGICTMNQNPDFIVSSLHGEGWTGTAPVPYQTSRFFYTTQAIDTKTETCGEQAPSAKWVEVPNDSLLPAGVTAVKMTWNPAVDQPQAANGITYLVARGYVSPNAPTSGEAWTTGAIRGPLDPSTNGFPSLNGWTNPSTATGGVDLPGSTYGPNMNGYRDAFRLQGPKGLITKEVSDTTAQPGVPVTYTLKAQAQNTITSPPPVSFTVVDTLPTGMEYVPGSADPAPASVSPDGRVLTWDLAGVEANVFQTIRYEAQTAPDSILAPGTSLTNVAVINVPGDNRPANTPGRTAYATVVVPSSSATIFGKSVDANVLSFEGDSSAWELTINSQDPVENEFTDTIDILPTVGDGRGTDIDGDYTVTGVDAPAGSTVYYTSEPFASLSNDPRDASNGGTPGSVTDNTVGWSTTAIAHPTAIRVIAPELAPGATQTIRIDFTTPAGSSCEDPAAGDNKPGQMLVNSASSFAGHTALPMLSSAITEIGNCYAVNLKKYVQDADGNWQDANTLAEYPSFGLGDIVRYRIVVENVGQGTVTNLDVTDDQQPALGNFHVALLLPGDTEEHEFEVTLDDPNGGTIVNTACGDANIPSDSEVEPTINCDPAGLVVFTDDFGDAPNSYNTTLADNGPRHTMVEGLTIGSKIDFDPDGQPNAGASGDDADRTADEEGVAGGITATTGQPTKVSVSATNNTAAVATLVGWIDLNGNGSFSDGERVSIPVPANSGTKPYDLDFPAGTFTSDTFARFRLFPGTPSDPKPTGAASAGEVEDYAVDVVSTELEIEKTSDATADSRPGDTITYTVSGENTGTGDYTTANPARVWDDMSGVLDDATYGGNASADRGGAPVYSEPIISWTGALPAGEKVTITYTVTLKGGGDGTVRNVAFEQCDPSDPDCDPVTPECDPPVGGVDPDTGKACAPEEFELPKLTISKVADRTDLPELGETVEYTVTVKNEGPGDYTTAKPGTISDDMSDVIDSTTDPDNINATVGTAAFSTPNLTWTGALASGDTATITYEVTYLGGGDQQLDNNACVPVTEAQDPQDRCATVRIPGSGLDRDKVSNPVSGTPVVVGEEVTYTLRFDNTGQTAATVDTFDDLSGVLDDADFVPGSITTDSGLTATYDGANERIDISGSVPVGDSLEVTYKVKVKAWADQGNHVLRNALQCQDGDPASCEPDVTEHPVPHITEDKTVDPEDGSTVKAGDELTYTLTFENDGEASGTVSKDDFLGMLLDDAEIVSGPTVAGQGNLTATFNVDRFEIRGTLDKGDKATVTYKVKVKSDAERAADGDDMIGNFIVDPGEEVTECLPTEDEDSTCNPIPRIVEEKTVDPEDGSTVVAGDELEYTLTFENLGKGTGTVSKDDFLGMLLDDAEIVSGPTVAGQGNLTATLKGDRFEIRGTLGAGDKATVTYKVKVKSDADRAADGDDMLGNFLIEPGTTPPDECLPTEDEDSTCNPVPRIVDWKSVTPSSKTPVVAGQQLTYTLTFTNRGEATGEVDKVDYLGHILDDADFVTGPTVSDPALSANRDDDEIEITGKLAKGQTVTVTYTVEVKSDKNRDADGGDDILANFLIEKDTTPPVDPEDCVPAEGEDADCTVNPVGEIKPSKSVNPETGTTVKDGQVLTYTLSFENPGKGAAKLDYTDHMAGVLDDATLIGKPKASTGVTVSGPTGGKLHVTGEVAAGETATVVYKVKVKGYGDQGNHHLGNFVTVTGEKPPTKCVAANPLCTENPIDPPPPSGWLPNTGGPTLVLLAVAALALLGGTALLIGGRRRRTTESTGRRIG